MPQRSTNDPKPLDAADTAAATAASSRDARFQAWIVALDQRIRRSQGDAAELLHQSLGELTELIGATGGQWLMVQPSQTTVLAAQGDVAGFPESVDDAAADHPDADDASQLTARVPLHDADHLLGRFRFAPRHPDPRQTAGAAEQSEMLVQATLDLLAPLVLRDRLCEANGQLAFETARQRCWRAVRTAKDGWQAAAALCRQIAWDSGAERVSLLLALPSGCRLIACSALNDPAGDEIDRRAEHVRLLERLASEVVAGTSLAGGTPLRHEGHDDSDSSVTTAWCVSLRPEEYCRASGAVQVRVDCLDADAGEFLNSEQTFTISGLAILVSERFTVAAERLPADACPLADDNRWLAPYGQPLAEVVRRCRYDLSWRGTLARWLRLHPAQQADRPATGRRRWLWAVAAAAIVSLLPVPLWVQANGRLVPQLRQRIFAPAEGIVTSLAVQGGQDVSAGQPLLQLQNAALDLARQQVVGSIATTQVQLAAGLATRAQGTGAASRGAGGLAGTASDWASQEESLKSQLAGLEQQLVLIDQQQAALQVTSPIAGRVIAWELVARFQNRPVVAGQHLLDIVGVDRGWFVQVEVPEDEIGYVLAARRAIGEKGAGEKTASGPACRFRLRSHPAIEYRGHLTDLASAVQIDGQGQPVVSAIAVSDAAGLGDEIWRVDAGALVWIDCGRRPLVFVYTRGLVRWGRAQLGW